MPSSALFEPILFFLCQKEKNGAAKMLAGNARPKAPLMKGELARSA